MGLSALTREFAAQIAPAMKTRGYRKAGPTWRRATGDTIQVLNLQKSDFGDSFYVNAGLYLTALGDETRPTEYRCHVRCRAERLMPPDDFAEMRGLLDFRTDVPDGRRYERLRELIATYPLAWLEKNTTEAALRENLSGSTKGLWVQLKVWQHLDLDVPAEIRG